jgi:hypothetical protein
MRGSRVPVHKISIRYRQWEALTVAFYLVQPLFVQYFVINRGRQK